MTGRLWRAAVLLGVACAALAHRPAAAQTLQNFIFTGCDQGYSCMRLVVTAPLDRSDPYGFDVTFRWYATFSNPGVLDRIWVESDYSDDDYVGPNSCCGPFALGTVTDHYTEWRGIGWTPLYGWYGAFHGPLGGDPHDEREERGGSFVLSHTTVTPEPASMLLLGSGLVAMVGAAARRRKRES